MNEKIDTVVFDLDGTLVDSQPATLGATIKALAHFDVHVTATDLREVFGGGARILQVISWREIWERNGRVRCWKTPSSYAVDYNWASPTKWSCYRM